MRTLACIGVLAALCAASASGQDIEGVVDGSLESSARADADGPPVLDVMAPPAPSALDVAALDSAAWTDEAYARGRALRADGDLPGAERALQAAVIRHPGSARLRNDLAVVLLAAGKNLEATRHLLEATTLAPEFTEPAVNLARVQEEGGHIALARATLERAHGAAPDEARVTLLLGLLEARAGQVARAAELFTSIPKANPHRADAAYNLGLLQLRAGDVAAAATSLAEAATAAPSRADAAYALGLAYVRQREDWRAASAFAEAESRSSTYAPWAARQIGRIRERAGVLDGAAAEYRRATRAAPAAAAWKGEGAVGADDLPAEGTSSEVALAYADLARVLSRMGRAREAASALKDAVALRDDDSLRFNYGVALALANDEQAAREQVETLRPRAPELGRRLDQIIDEALRYRGKCIVSWGQPR